LLFKSVDSRNLGDYLMKKSLLVLAVAAAVPALAQAQTNVTMYGRVDQSIGVEKNGAGTAISVLSGVQSSNRWGVRGAEDLGGGLKAIFNLEAGFDADIGRGNPTGSNSNTAGALDFRRRSVAGLEGGFGSLVFGRDYDPLFRVLLGSDNLGLGHYGNVHTIYGTAYGVRIDNGIHYVSPSLGGLVLRGAYGFSERFAATATDAKANGANYSLALEYAGGPVYAGLGYRANLGNAGTTSGGLQNSGASKFLAAGARINFGAFAFNVGGGRGDPFGPNTTTTGQRTAIWLGADVQAGPGRLHAQYGTWKTDFISGVDAKGNSIGVTYNYPLSKRTTMYATLGRLANNTTGNFTLGTSSTGIAPSVAGKDPLGVALGVGHNF
jgi:predicted porin